MTIIRDLRTAIAMTIALVIVTGLIYPLTVTGAAQVLFRDRADGSLIERDGDVVGSKYIGQAFAQDRYFRGRISAAGATFCVIEGGLENELIRDRIRISHHELQDVAGDVFRFKRNLRVERAENGPAHVDRNEPGFFDEVHD